MREIWLLGHEDKFSEGLTARQKKELKVQFNKANEIRRNELGFDENQVGYSHKQLGVLITIRNRMRKIWDVAGVDLNPELVLEGTLAERISILRADILRLEKGIAQVNDQLIWRIDDYLVNERRQDLAFPEQNNAVREALLEEAKWQQEEAIKLQRQLDGLFDEPRHVG